jgi:CheY-like chemotaxis protein
VSAASPCKRVLVVDDDFSTREALSLILAGGGYRVSLACNGAEALARLRHPDRPDLIVLDLKMPVLDGAGFCRQCREEEGMTAVPLIVLSALADAEHQATLLGATACLKKPVDPIDLLLVLRKCCPNPTPGAAPVG